MPKRSDLRRELRALRGRAVSAIEHLRMLQHELGKTRRTIDRAEQAYRESLDLLRHVEEARSRR